MRAGKETRTVVWTCTHCFPDVTRRSTKIAKEAPSAPLNTHLSLKYLNQPIDAPFPHEKHTSVRVLHVSGRLEGSSRAAFNIGGNLYSSRNDNPFVS